MMFSYDTPPALYNACPVFAAAIPHLLRAYGRGAEADARRTAALGPLVQALRNSRSDAAGVERSAFAMAELARQWAARALDAAGLPSLAAELRDCAGIVDARTAVAAEAVASAVAAAASAKWTAAAAAREAAVAARAAHRAVAARARAELAMQSARLAAAHAADAARHAAESVAYAAKSGWTDSDALDMCVTELLALVQRENALRAGSRPGVGDALAMVHAARDVASAAMHRVSEQFGRVASNLDVLPPLGEPGSARAWFSAVLFSEQSLVAAAGARPRAAGLDAAICAIDELWAALDMALDERTQ